MHGEERDGRCFYSCNQNTSRIVLLWFAAARRNGLLFGSTNKFVKANGFLYYGHSLFIVRQILDLDLITVIIRLYGMYHYRGEEGAKTTSKDAFPGSFCLLWLLL